MSKLSIIFDVRRVNVETDVKFVYSIGSPRGVDLGDFISLNNSVELSELALKIRTEYISSISEIYKSWNSVWQSNTKLFPYNIPLEAEPFRTEYSNSFRIYVNLKYIEILIRRHGIKVIRLVGGSVAEREAFFLYLGDRVRFESDCHHDSIQNILARYLGIAKVLLLIINNYVQVTLKSIIFFWSSGGGTSVRKYDRLYLTRYPAGFRSYGDAVEEKYGKLSRATDRFLVDVISNNVIQTVSCIAAFHLGRFARSRPNSYVFLDSKFDFFDVFQTFVSVIDFMRRLCRVIIGLENEKNNIAFLSRLVCGDLKRGAIALPGNIYFALKISRLYSLSNVKQLVLYMHEYGYGRIATYISRSIGVFVVGYQHGPFSPSRLIYYGGSMAVETSLAPLVLAESQAARVAYKSGGHRRVLVLTSDLPRLRYLSKIKRSGGRGTYIVLGLHDGQRELDKLIELSYSMTVSPPLLKLHPRSGFRPRPSSAGEYHIAECDITALLGGADSVLGTYSSVLEEAKYLGIKTICYSRDGYISELIQ